MKSESSLLLFGTPGVIYTGRGETERREVAKNTREKRDVDVALGGKILVTDAGGQRRRDAIDGRVPQSVIPSRPFLAAF